MTAVVCASCYKQQQLCHCR